MIVTNKKTRILLESPHNFPNTNTGNIFCHALLLLTLKSNRAYSDRDLNAKANWSGAKELGTTIAAIKNRQTSRPENHMEGRRAGTTQSPWRDDGCIR